MLDSVAAILIVAINLQHLFAEHFQEISIDGIRF